MLNSLFDLSFENSQEMLQNFRLKKIWELGIF